MYQYVATVKHIVDGDTVDMLVDLGFNVSTLVRFRLEGINAPEMTGGARELGKAARGHLDALLASAQLGLIRVDSKGRDKYGRWIAQLQYADGASGNIINVSDRMIADGFAIASSG